MRRPVPEWHAGGKIGFWQKGRAARTAPAPLAHRSARLWHWEGMQQAVQGPGKGWWGKGAQRREKEPTRKMREWRFYISSLERRGTAGSMERLRAALRLLPPEARFNLLGTGPTGHSTRSPCGACEGAGSLHALALRVRGAAAANGGADLRVPQNGLQHVALLGQVEHHH